MLGKVKRKAASKALGISEKEIAQMEILQKELAAMQFRHEDKNIVVKVTGDMKIAYLEIDGEPKSELVKVINKAFEKSQKEIQKKMMGQMGGMGGLLGKLQ